MLFDDPKKNLRRMEEALWEAEREAAPEEPGEEADWLQEARELLGEEPPKQNRAVDFSRTVFDDEEMDSRAYVPRQKKKKGARGLLILALLELIGLAAVAVWWIRWLM